MRNSHKTASNKCLTKHHIGLHAACRGLTLVVYTILVVCAMAFCGWRLAFASQESALSITVASDRYCNLRITRAELNSDGCLRFYLTLFNRSDEEIKLWADNDWTCNGKSVSAITGDISAKAGKSRDDFFFMRNVDSSAGSLVVKGTLLLKDEDLNVVTRYSFNSGKIGLSVQGKALPIAVASDDLCRLTVTKAKLGKNNNLSFYYTLSNRSDEELRLQADDDWTCDGGSVDVITGLPSIDTGEYRDDYFFADDVDQSRGRLEVKGTLMLVDENNNVVARYRFHFDDPENIEGFEWSGGSSGSMPSSHVDGGGFLRSWCGAYYYEIGMRYPEAWSSDVRSGWINKVRSYVSRSSDLYSIIEGRYDSTLKDTLTCVMDAKSLLTSGNYEKFEVTVRRAIGGWDGFSDHTEYWLVYYADDGKVCQAVKTVLSPKAT